MPGRPASTTRSDPCSPPILASRSRSPVVSPDTWPVRLNARSAPWIASVSARSKLMKPPATAAVGGELEQRMLRRLDLLRAVEFGVRAERVVHHGLADVDQLAAQPGVVDRAAVLAGVDDADHGGEQLRQVGGAADLLQHAGMLEFRLQRHRVGELAGFHAADDRLVDAAVDRIGEMLGGEELRDPLVRAVVGEQRTKQRLLRLQVGRRQALRETEQWRIDGVHGQDSIRPCKSRGERPSLWIGVVPGDESVKVRGAPFDAPTGRGRTTAKRASRVARPGRHTNKVVLITTCSTRWRSSRQREHEQECARHRHGPRKTGENNRGGGFIALPRCNGWRSLGVADAMKLGTGKPSCYADATWRSPMETIQVKVSREATADRGRMRG